MQTHISSNLFVSFFRPCIRVLFDWERFQKERWPIQLAVADDLSSISPWYLPWHFDATGKEVKYDSPAGRPIQLASIAKHMLTFDDERRQKILEMSSFFLKDRDHRRPAQLVAPTYVLPNNLRIILDGNHRMAALMLAKIPFRLLVFSIHGPMDNAVMPELRHWDESPNVRVWE
nr:hypothetical protein [Gammaproteobacteria bacterium]